MRTPKKVSGDAALHTVAVGALARRAYSVFEMRQYLERRASETEAARRILARLRQGRFLDDARYALDFARYRARVRRQGRYRIERELRARGVSDAHIEGAIEQVFTEIDEVALVRTAIARRLKTLRGPFDQRKAASLYRVLLRGGFDSQVIHREIRAATRGAGAETTGWTKDFAPEESE